MPLTLLSHIRLPLIALLQAIISYLEQLESPVDSNKSTEYRESSDPADHIPFCLCLEEEEGHHPSCHLSPEQQY